MRAAVSHNQHPSSREKHDAAALEAALSKQRQRIAEQIRERERERVTRVLLCDRAVADSEFEGCVD